MDLKSEFQSYIDACRLYRRDLQDVVNDLTFLEKRGNKIRYAIDFSEIHAYILPKRASTEFFLFSDDLEETAGIKEYLSLRRLFDELGQKLVLLRPYAIEFDAFLLRFPERVFSDEMSSFLNVHVETRYLMNLPEFKLFSELVSKSQELGDHINSEDYKRIVDFLQRYAPNILFLLEPSRERPVERIKSIFDRELLENYTDLVSEVKETDKETSTYKYWHRALRSRRSNRDDVSGFQSILDSEAADLLEKGNHALKAKKTKLLLVTRSPHMLQIDEQHPFRDLWSTNGDRLLRHPRTFYLLHALNGRTVEELKHELGARLETIELFLESAESEKLDFLNTEDHRINQIKALLEKVKKSWRSSEALDAFLGDSLPTKRRSKVDENTIERVFGLLRENGELNRLILSRLKDLSQSLIREHQVLGFYIQGLDPHDREILKTSIKVWNYPQKFVFRTKLQAIPYSFQFYSEPAGELLEVLGSLEEYSWDDALQAFITIMEKHENFDYELSLAMAFIFGTLGNWKLAEDYCERAIELVEGNIPIHESYFFLAICMRKRQHSFKRYMRSIELIDEATKMKRAWMGNENYQDPRYLKEKGTQILRIKLEFNKKMPKNYQVADGLKLLDKAMQYCENDILLKIQIVNNRLYYYIASNQYKQEKINSIAELDYRLLLELQEEVESNEEKWPPFISDTLAWAEFKLFDVHSEESKLRIHNRFTNALQSDDLKLDSASRKEYENHYNEFMRFIKAP